METLLREKDRINNLVYDSLGDRWYQAEDDPIALLRAEAELRNPWVLSWMKRVYGERPCRLLDVGCGGGFLANAMARVGQEASGIDLSRESLEVARKYDLTRTVRYQQGDAYRLPYADGRFEVVCAMDFLEHVEEPEGIVREASRVLSPGGLLFFYTHNRTFLSWLVVIKGVEWFVRNTPERMHLYRLFVRPAELAGMCARNGLEIESLVGVAPVLRSTAFWKMILTGAVPRDFRFKLTGSIRISYLGVARKGLGDGNVPVL